MTDLVKLTIDNIEISVPKGTSILRACELAEIQVPRFCYHSRLSIAGNCRMCLVELDGAPKPVASCAFPVAEGQVVRTQSQIAKDARKAVMEFLLANHPLDCPLCDQGGECDLQDFSVGCGSDKGEFSLNKRTVNNPDLGPYIQTFMNRCIHCMRCVRFADEIAGKNEIGGLFRGGDKIITNAENGHVTSNLSGNMIDLCPVGALTSKPAKYKYRSWELAKHETVDVTDSILPSIYADTKDNKVIRIRARENDEINQEWISDCTRFSYDGIFENRITSPLLKNNEVSWNKAFDEVLENLHETNPKNIAGLVGDNLSLEDLFSFKQFMKNTLGVTNIDYLSNGFALNKFNKANVTFETSIADIDNADAILFVGTDLQNQSPVLNSRIFQQARLRDIAVFNIGKQVEQTYKVNNISANPSALLEEHKALDKAFKKAENSIIFVDVENILTRDDASAILNKVDELAKLYGSKVNFYSISAGFINSVEVFANEEVYPHKQLLKDLESEEIEILFVYANSKIDPQLARKAKVLVYIGTHVNEVSKIADVVLPSVTTFEKNSLYNNVEGNIIEVNACILPYADAKVDWKIFRALSEFVGEKLEFNSLDELRELIEPSEEKTSYITNKKATKISQEDIINKFENIKNLNEITSNSKYYK